MTFVLYLFLPFCLFEDKNMLANCHAALKVILGKKTRQNGQKTADGGEGGGGNILLN